MIKITQGDTPTIKLTAEKGDGRPFDISAGTFESRIAGPTGTVIFGNSKHTIIDTAAGRFNLSLAASDTNALNPGPGREIVTIITQGVTITAFHAVGALEVLIPNPVQ